VDTDLLEFTKAAPTLTMYLLYFPQPLIAVQKHEME